MIGKRGQFYLIAALVIVSIAAGFVVITNKATTVQDSGITYTKGELSTESSYIINYGINNGFSDSQIEDMLTNLSEYYINNTQSSNLYFLIGTDASVKLVAYQTYYANVTVNGALQNIGTDSTYTNTFSSPGSSINIKINDTSYDFKINSGENFHFVIESLDSGQEYTISK